MRLVVSCISMISFSHALKSFENIDRHVCVVCCPVKMQYATTNKELLANRLEDRPFIFILQSGVDVRGCVVCVCVCVSVIETRSFFRYLVLT